MKLLIGVARLMGSSKQAGNEICSSKKVSTYIVCITITHNMKASAQDSSIRVISLLRRVGSIAVVLVIFLLLFFNVYHRINDRLWISELKDIYANGVSKLANVEENYKIQRMNNNLQLTFKYSFKEADKMYNNEYILHQSLPNDTDALTRIFTVYYLKDDPEKNSLNIEGEIERIETNIEESSMVWLIVKVFITLIVGFILIGQVISLISEVKNLDKPIEIPVYQKKE